MIKAIPRSKEKAGESFNAAECWLKEAENNLESQAFRSCILSSYLAMFHSARAVMFLEGFREKSHFAVARFLEIRFVKNELLEEKWAKLFDFYRETRHEDQYSTLFSITEAEVKNSLNSAKEFVKRMKLLAEKALKK
ncbi:MAG: HEPN domain-containing protein [Candidatus Diapherotrites archaeon]|uniref:HEPN domain-containing protein n=1 Tax=Candidatus Iainarchaeum sp. TaxID=3101447 RepID=A0A8T4KSN5_9ARCH|nr:HEPN domain-containing protein [Candidatus Diapherotrites archaeon]